MFATGRGWTMPQKWGPPPPAPPNDGGGGYRGERFWDPDYRSNPGRFHIGEALAEHNARIGERVRDLRRLAAEAEAAQGTQGGPTRVGGTSVGLDMPPMTNNYIPVEGEGAGFFKTLWENMKEYGKGKDGEWGLTDLGKLGSLLTPEGLAAAGIKIGAGTARDLYRQNGGLGGMFDFNMEGNPDAANDAFLDAIRRSGLGMGETSGGTMGPMGPGSPFGPTAPRGGAPLDPSGAGFNAGPDWTRPDATRPGIPGYGGPGGPGGPGGGGGYPGWDPASIPPLPPGFQRHPINPMMTMDWTYQMQPAGGGPPISVISGPQWIGPPGIPPYSPIGSR